MASAKKCDRCGKFYIVNTLPGIAKLVLYEYRTFQYNEVDLCPDCSQELKDWFERPIKERESK